MVGTDEFLLSVEPYATRDAWCRDRVAATRKRLEDLDWMTPTVLVNHFPLVREPCDAMFYPEFSLWCGTTATADWHTRYNAICSVYGHLHIPRTTWYDGVRLRRGVGRLSARVAAPQAVSLAAADTAGPEVRAGLPQRVRRSLPDHRRRCGTTPRRCRSASRARQLMTIVATLLSDVLPGIDALAAAEMYDDPPELAPLPEEEPLIAKSVAKRRNEFITVRYCARQALGELGVPPVPILKGDKGEPCWPDGVVGSLTHCTGFRGAAVGRHGAVRSVGIDAEPHDVLPKGVLDADQPAEGTCRIAGDARRPALGPNPVLRQGGDVQGVVSADAPLARLRGCPHHVRRRRQRHCGRVRITHPHRPGRRVGPAAETLSGRWSVRDGLALTAIVL